MITKSIKHTILTFCSVCCGITATTALTSCEDYLTIYPTDKTTGKDYWQKKDHVNEMVAGAYKQMTSGDAEERAIMWGSYRSDDVVKSENYKNNDMDYISAVNLYSTQGICRWDVFYSVINRCNQVLAHAPEVMQLDPEFTEGDYEVARGQMLALRALSYFYLVRAFRDVPFVEQAFEGDEQVVEVAQSTPYDVLQHCIDDLEEAAGLVMHSGGYNDWRDYGYITQDACWAILADIYLWRASMTGSQTDYQKVVYYAERVIDSKDALYRKNYRNQLSQLDDADRYHLYEWSASRYYETPQYYIFVRGNSRESILEFQYNTNNANGTLASYLFRDGDDKSYSRLMASPIFNTTIKDGANTENATKVFFSEDDYRFWAYLYDVNDENLFEQHIRKYGTMEGNLPRTMTTGSNGDKWTDRNADVRSANNFDVNWIVYRLTDLMLLEAEARVQLAAADDVDDPQLRQAFNLVQTVSKRSMKDRSKDTLNISNFPSRGEMELLVLSERHRELCFESKRWFDLMRYGYRHMQGVDARSLMADHTEWPALYKPMVALASRSYTTGAEIFNLKMKSEPYLYWPINEDETKVNHLLKQNPVFILAKESQRQ